MTVISHRSSVSPTPAVTPGTQYSIIGRYFRASELLRAPGAHDPTNYPGRTFALIKCNETEWPYALIIESTSDGTTTRSNALNSLNYFPLQDTTGLSMSIDRLAAWLDKPLADGSSRVSRIGSKHRRRRQRR